MTNIIRTGLLAVTLVVVAMDAHGRSPTYILNGYTFQDFPGMNTTKLAAKLKHKEGDHYTAADLAVDQAILTRELQRRHIAGRLVTGLAEKRGRVWVMFDVQNLNPPSADAPIRHLELQEFTGAIRISAIALAAATHLKNGDILSPKKINAARQAIIALYAKSLPSKEVSVRGKMQIRPDGRVKLTWTIGEPK